MAGGSKPAARRFKGLQDRNDPVIEGKINAAVNPDGRVFRFGAIAVDEDRAGISVGRIGCYAAQAKSC